MNKNIFLIGFMGSGKSHWGRIWSLKHGYTFHDLDAEVEKVFKMSVQDIFEKHGEGKFRELERDQLRKFANKKKSLLACGGGTPCFFDNIDWMKQHGEVIYLKAAPDYILDRVMDETTKRPLLKEVNTSELLFFIQKKLKEREPEYLKAHHILNVNSIAKNSLKFLFEQQPVKIMPKKNESEIKEMELPEENDSSKKLKTRTVHHA